MSTAAMELEDHRPRRIDWRAWGRLASLARVPRRTLVLLLAGAFGMATADALLPLVTRAVIDELVEHGAEAKFAPHVAANALLIVLLCTSIVVFIRCAGVVSTRVAHDVRQAAFERLQVLSPAFHESRPSGWLVARLTSDCDRLGQVLAWGLVDFAWGGSVMLAIGTVLVVLDPWLALAVLSIVPVAVIVSLLFQRVILQSARRIRRENSRLTAAYNETVMGASTTKVLCREEADLAEFRALSRTMEEASLRNALQSAAYVPVIMTLGSVATALGLGLGGHLTLAGSLGLGTLVAVVHYATFLFEPAREVAARFAQLQMAQAAAERVLGLIATEPDVRDSEEVVAALEAAAERPAAPGIATDGGRDAVEEVRFHDVSFAYGDGPPVLRDVDLAARSGETIALVGPTGGGKTTLVSLLARFFEPTCGEILVDGTDYRRRSLAWWRSQLAMVLQEPRLFAGSVRENVRYGRLDATDEEVERAVDLVGATDLVESLPERWDTQVGEGGSRLSTGQRQLLSFARALLAEPRVLILDEATSSIDLETERRIQDGLAAVVAGRLSFVIAHRLSTVRSADRIVVVEGGRLVEQGRHEELLARRGRYHALVGVQRGSDSGLPGGTLPAT